MTAQRYVWVVATIQPSFAWLEFYGDLVFFVPQLQFSCLRADHCLAACAWMAATDLAIAIASGSQTPHVGTTAQAFDLEANIANELDEAVSPGLSCNHK